MAHDGEAGLVFVRVRRHSPGAGLHSGDVLAVPPGRARVGRAPDCELVLADASVSRHHLVIDTTQRAIAITPLVSHNGTFVAGEAVAAGSSAALSTLPALVQLGGVVLEVHRLDSTEPVKEALSPETLSTPGAQILDVFRDAQECVIHFGGHELDLPASAARVVAALAVTPGTPVHHWDLQEAIGGSGNLGQLVSLARRALREVIDRDPALRAEVERRLETAGIGEPLGGHSSEQLMRIVIGSRRNHGYILRLNAADVALTEV